MLPDTGIRDENGLEPMDHLFSSPEKPRGKLLKKINSNPKNPSSSMSSEEDMDVGESKSLASKTCRARY
jgi:centromere protein C